MYYRVATQVDAAPTWQWRSTVLSSLQTLIKFLQVYRAFPQDRLRVFSSSSREDLSEQLRRKNTGGESTSVTAAQFLQQRRLCVPERAGEASECGEQERVFIAVAPNSSSNESSSGAFYQDARGMSPLERRRREIEGGAGGDHDLPYSFTLPNSALQVRAWMKLLSRVQDGAFQP
jgi:hypothetical protein